MKPLYEYIDVLNANRALKKFSNDAKGRFMEKAEIVFYQKGKKVISEGDTSDFFYVVTLGSAAVYKRDENGNKNKVASLGVGDIFGHHSIVLNAKGARGKSTIEAEEDMEVYRMSANDLRTFFRGNAAVLAEMRKEAFESITADVDDDLFKRALTNSSLREGALRVVVYQDGEMIYNQGDKPSEAFFMLGGQAVLKNGERIVAEINTGNIFGHKAIEEGNPRAASAYSVGTSHVLQVEGKDYLKSLRGSMELKRYVESQEVLFKSRKVGIIKKMGLGKLRNTTVKLPLILGGLSAAGTYGMSHYVAAKLADAGANEEVLTAANDTMMLTTGVVGAVAFVTAIFLARRVTSPMNEIKAAMTRMAAGAKDVKVAATNRKDEIGHLANALVSLKEKMDATQVSIERSAAERVSANGNSAKVAQFVEEYRKTIEGLQNQLNGSVSEISAVSAQILSGANNSVSSSNLVIEASKAATESVDEVANVTNQLSDTISDISDKTKTSSERVGDAVDQVEAATTSMNELETSSSQIGEIIDLIQSIASQTRLLSLNATIEAARAGEAGKGFAVVATEVKNLANQTSSATEDIAEQVTAVQNAAQSVISAIRQVSETVNGLEKDLGEIVDAVGTQSEATARIMDSVTDATDKTQEVSDHVNSITSIVSESGRGAESLNDYSASLSQRTASLSNSLSEFMDKVAD